MNGMIDYKFCTKLIKQFSDHPSYPETADGLKIRIETLQKRAKSESHATAVIAKLIETKQFCPTPAEIVTACEEMGVPEQQAMRADPDCRLCGGSGWQHEKRPDGRGGFTEHGAKCPCRAVRSAPPWDSEHRRQQCGECGDKGYIETAKGNFAPCECHLGGNLPEGFLALLNGKNRALKPAFPNDAPEWLDRIEDVKTPTKPMQSAAPDWLKRSERDAKTRASGEVA
jgi:hypothetical protein